MITFSNNICFILMLQPLINVQYEYKPIKIKNNIIIIVILVNNNFLADVPTEFKVLVYKYQDDDYKESVNITFNNKKRVLRMLVDFVEYHFEEADERTVKKTVRTFLNDKVLRCI